MIQLLDFYADWCGPCQVMKPIFKEIEKDYEGKVEFRQVDVETDGAAEAAQYGVMSIPTFVILKEGKEVSRKIGAMPKDVLRNWIDNNL
ncbi:MAG TPA: thioredoxin [Patescibacteria group bacterium]|nr:thioredoxin [Patescibacteria group bacterium]